MSDTDSDQLVRSEYESDYDSEDYEPTTPPRGMMPARKTKPIKEVHREAKRAGKHHHKDRVIHNPRVPKKSSSQFDKWKKNFAQKLVPLMPTTKKPRKPITYKSEESRQRAIEGRQKGLDAIARNRKRYAELHPNK